MGIRHFAKIVKIIQRWLPNALIGANYAPTKFFVSEADGQSYCNSYLGETYQWIRTFKEGGSTLPWAEDWQWQTPLGTQQMEALPLTVQRASMTHWPLKKIERGQGVAVAGTVPKPSWGKDGRPPQMMYLLPEFPGEQAYSHTDFSLTCIIRTHATLPLHRCEELQAPLWLLAAFAGHASGT